MDSDAVRQSLFLSARLRRFADLLAEVTRTAPSIALVTCLGLTAVLRPAPAEAAGDPLARTAGVIGILPLPEVFGQGGCAPFVGRDIQVYPQPDRIGRSVLTLHAAPARAAAPASGGCELLRALVSPAGSRTGPELPTVEGGYEAAAAIVLERRPRWYRIVLPVGSGWIRMDDTRRFIPLTRLFDTRMTYLRSGVLLPLAAEPGAPLTAGARPLAADVPAKVVATRRLDGVLWLQVDTRGAETCGQAAPAPLSGWVPVHDERRRGLPSVWFWSRGC